MTGIATKNPESPGYAEIGSSALIEAPTTDCLQMSKCDHFVQFYEADPYLIDSVAKFAKAGWKAGEPFILIATKEHEDALKDTLEQSGIDIRKLKQTGQYQSWIAQEVLSEFMLDGTPDETLFMSALGGRISRVSKQGVTLRAFGEMVAILLEEGNGRGAMALERLWNKLAEKYSFSLFCAYPLAAFEGEEKGTSLSHICEVHSRVIPTESYCSEESSEDRLRSIALLQQKARSLELEVIERKKAECALREQQARLTVAIAVAKLGIWELDLVTRDFICSDQARLHLGLGNKEALDLGRFIAAVHPKEQSQVETALSSAIRTNSDFRSEFRVGPKEDKSRWVAAMGRCFHNGSHRMLGVTMDINERKKGEELLEATVAQRTAQLQDTIEELEAFSYSISHDMRAPLRSMRSFADILNEECGQDLKPEHREYLRRIAASGQKMDQLIQDILTFSRVTRSELHLEPVNLNHLVLGILECYPNLQPPHASIVIRDELPLVIGNAAALTQCFSNLLGNAVKFVPGGVLPSIQIWAEVQAPCGSLDPRVRIQIKDNGIGISQMEQGKIFGIFQRVSKKYDGTGIGLSIVRKAAERMGGQVGVISEEGAGSTFWLDLPLPPQRAESV